MEGFARKLTDFLVPVTGLSATLFFISSHLVRVNLSMTSNLQLLASDVDQAVSLLLTKKQMRKKKKCYQTLCYHRPSLCIISLLQMTNERLTTKSKERCRKRTPLCLLRNQEQMCCSGSARSLLSLVPPGAGTGNAQLSEHISAFKELHGVRQSLKSWARVFLKGAKIFPFILLLLFLETNNLFLVDNSGHLVNLSWFRVCPLAIALVGSSLHS